MTTLHGQGQIFTTEPLAMRGFAAELRYDLGACSQILNYALGHTISKPSVISCEVSSMENLDIVVTLENGETVGIEGKIAHEITEEQIEREAKNCDHFVILTKDKEDINGLDGGLIAGVITWSDALDFLVESRISVEDINAVNDEKRIVRRKLQNLRLHFKNADWEISHMGGQSGFPSIMIESTGFSDGREFVAQIQAKRGVTPTVFEATAGLRVDWSDFVEDVHSSTAGGGVHVPTWVCYAREIGSYLETRLKGTIAEVSGSSARASSSEASKNKMQQARDFALPLNYAVGYVTSHVGVRTIPVDPENLQRYVDVLLPAIEGAHDHLLKMQ